VTEDEGGIRPPSSRLTGADSLRAVATVAVVVIHTSAWGPTSTYTNTALLARFSVPAFMVLTGLLLAYRYTGRPLGTDFARARLARTLVPWLVWIPVFLVLDLWPMQMLPQDGGQVAQWVAEGGGHLWYLLLIPQFYVLFARWPQRHTVAIAAGALLLQTGLGLWRLYGPLPAGPVQTLVLQYGYLLFPFWIGYFAVGVALGRNWRMLRRSGRAAVASAGAAATLVAGWLLVTITFAEAPYVTFLNGTGAFLDPVLPLLVFSIAALVMSATPPLMQRSSLLRNVTRTVSDNSLGIYIIHPIVLFYLGTYTQQWLYASIGTSVAWFLIDVAGSVLGSLAATRLITATPLAPIVGVSRRGLFPLHRAVRSHR